MRHTATIAAAAAISATAASFAIAQASDPPARSSATDRAVVPQLKKLNSTARRIELRSKETRDEVDDLRKAQATFCRALAERSYSCPSSF